MIDKKEVAKLAGLARIEISNQQAEKLCEDINSIVAYVSEIQKITKDQMIAKGENTHKPFLAYRDDSPGHNPGEFSEQLLSSSAGADGRYIKVKKIL
jgi:aspartyl/glutamyl-tRNA(Asn/Gln) amidotransferase C subunit